MNYKVFVTVLLLLAYKSSLAEEIFIKEQITFEAFEDRKARLIDKFSCSNSSNTFQQKQLLITLLFTERKSTFEQYVGNLLSKKDYESVKSLEKGKFDLFNEEIVCVQSKSAYISAFNIVKSSKMQHAMGWTVIYKVAFSKDNERVYLKPDKDFEQDFYHIYVPVSSFYSYVEFSYVND